MTLKFGILCFPGVQQVDLTGPYEVFASANGVEVELVWKDLAPLRASTGLWLSPARRLAEAPRYDLICVAGGGVNALLSDAEVLGFLRAQGSAARYVTSVCTGASNRAGWVAGWPKGHDTLERARPSRTLWGHAGCGPGAPRRQRHNRGRRDIGHRLRPCGDCRGVGAGRGGNGTAVARIRAGTAFRRGDARRRPSGDPGRGAAQARGVAAGAGGAAAATLND